MRVPHDVPDLYLAPLLLALDDRLNELALLDCSELSTRVAIDSDRPDRTPEMRRSGLMRSLERFIDCHGWELSWHERGVCVARDAHSVVLGTPRVFQSYLDSGPPAKQPMGASA